MILILSKTVITIILTYSYDVIKSCGPVFDAVYKAHVTPAVVAGAVGALHCAASANTNAAMMFYRPFTQMMRL